MEGGLISIPEQGREKYCEARLQLHKLLVWLEQEWEFYEAKLNSLKLIWIQCHQKIKR